MARTEVVVSGVGGAAWALGAGAPQTTIRAYPPDMGDVEMPCRPGAPLDIQAHVPNPADQRAIGAHFMLGVCAASAALKAARLDGGALADTAVFSATRSGDRIDSFDRAAFALEPREPAPMAEVNRLMMTGLRPTAFLSQIPNLLSGDISIVLGVKGDSRTFIGEEMAGFNALHAAIRLIEAGQLRRALVGGAFNSARENVLRWLYASGDKDALYDGAILASAGSYLVLEARGGCEARGVRPLASIRSVFRRRVRVAAEGDYVAAVAEGWAAAGPQGRTWVVSNAAAPTRRAVEAQALASLADPPVATLLTSDLVGATLEADGPLQASIAALALEPGRPGLGAGLPDTEAPEQIVVITGGQRRDLGCLVLGDAS